MIVSFKPAVASVLSGSLDGQLAALFATVRPGDMWTAWHEGEAHVDTPADFIAMLSRMYPIFRANAPASALFGEIHMSYTATTFSSFKPLSKWLSCPANGGTLLDFIGIDCYPVSNSDSWATLINPVVTEVTSVIPAASMQSLSTRRAREPSISAPHWEACGARRTVGRAGRR